MGDHGQIDIYWQAPDSDPNGRMAADPQWFCETYYWLVDKLGYQTWESSKRPCPMRPPGSPGGLPMLDAPAARCRDAQHGREPGCENQHASRRDRLDPAGVIAALVTAGCSKGIQRFVQRAGATQYQLTAQALAQQPINIVNIDSGTTVINSN